MDPSIPQFTPAGVREQLLAMAEPSFRDFVVPLTPGAGQVIGVRIPRLRTMARDIVRGDWQTFLKENPLYYFEERMLQGFVIGYASCSIEEKLSYITAFIPLIDNWSICDSFCWSLKKGEREAMWQFIQPYFHSKKEFEVRFAVVMALRNFVEEMHISILFDLLEGACADGYYARMGIAWAVSVCYVKFPRRTLAFLRHTSLDDETYNRSLQKMVESRRVSAVEKAKIRDMKRK